MFRKKDLIPDIAFMVMPWRDLRRGII